MTDETPAETPTAESKSAKPDVPPDHLSIDPASKHFDADLLRRGIGIRFKGAVRTNIEAPFHSEHAAAVLGPIMQTTIPAPAESEDLAATITYLLSDDARNMNGAIVACDGGWSAI